MKLEIGPGEEKLGEDWTTVSVHPGPQVDRLCEWGLDALPFADGTLDLVYASHVIEHIHLGLVPAALMEAWRVLRRGGVIELHTVDFNAVIDKYFEDESAMDWVNYRIFAYPKHGGMEGRDPNMHRSCFTRPFLERLLSDAGFADFQDLGEPRGPEKHPDINMGIGARKA